MCGCLYCLIRDAEHEIQRDVGKTRLAGGLKCFLRVIARVHPVESFERFVVERLDADADPVDARLAQCGEALGFRRPGVRLQRDFAIRIQVEQRGDEVQNALRFFRWKQRGCAPAEKYRLYPPAFQGELLDAAFHLLHQRIRIAARPVLTRVAFFQQGIEGVGVEIAIPAFGDAKRNVDVK